MVLLVLVLVVTFSIVRGDFSILMPYSLWFCCKKLVYNVQQCSQSCSVPVALVFGFTRTDTVFYCGILNIQVCKRVGMQVDFQIAEEKNPEEQCFEQRLELKSYGILLLCLQRVWVRDI